MRSEVQEFETEGKKKLRLEVYEMKKCQIYNYFTTFPFTP